MNTNYKPYINPAREVARHIRNAARYEAAQKAGVCSESMQDTHGLPDLEYCYFLRMGKFMPSKKSNDE